MLESRVYWALSKASNYLLLNLLWLLTCLPVVTIFPATAAMFATVREWQRNEDATFYFPFVRHLRHGFFKNLLFGLLWVLLGALLFLNTTLSAQMGGAGRAIFFPLGLLFLLAYAGASVFVFPVLVHYDLPWWQAAQNALLISLAQLGTTALCLLVVAATVVLFLALPVSLFVSGSITARLVYALCARAFRRVEALKQRAETPSQDTDG